MKRTGRRIMLLLVLLSLLLPKQNVCDLNQKRQTYLT